MRYIRKRKMIHVISPSSFFFVVLLLLCHGLEASGSHASSHEPRDRPGRNAFSKGFGYSKRSFESFNGTDSNAKTVTHQPSDSGASSAGISPSTCDTECKVHRLRGLYMPARNKETGVWVQTMSPSVTLTTPATSKPQILQSRIWYKFSIDIEDSKYCNDGQCGAQFINLAVETPSLFSLDCRGPPCDSCTNLGCQDPPVTSDCRSHLLYELEFPLDNRYSTIFWYPNGAEVLTLTSAKNKTTIAVSRAKRYQTLKIIVITEGNIIRVAIPSITDLDLHANVTADAVLVLKSFDRKCRKHASKWILDCLDQAQDQGISINASRSHLPRDFGSSNKPVTATAKEMLSVVRNVTLLPSDVLKAVAGLETLEEKFQRELNHLKPDEALKLSKGYAADVVGIVGEVLEKPDPWKELKEADGSRAFGRVQDLVASAALSVGDLLSSNEAEDFRSDSLHVRVSRRRASDYDAPARHYEHLYFPNTSIDLPELFYRGYVDESNNVQVVFSSYMTLHSVINTLPLDPSNATPDVFPAKDQVNSGILNAIVGAKGLWRAGEGDAVEVRLGHVYKGDTFRLSHARCVWWDEHARAWNESGCVLNHTDAHVTVCRCNHLTSLALLMDVDDLLADDDVMKSASYVALQWITILGCSSSVICLALCIAVILVLKQLRETTCWKTRCQLCVSLLSVHLLVLGGLGATEKQWLCLLVSVLLHYSLLTTFTWGVVESFNMYLKFGRVWRTQRSLFKYYMAVGYGFPAIVVSVTLAITKTEGYYTENACKLAPGAMLWSFVGLLAVILAVNLLAFVMVMRLLISVVMKSKRHHPQESDGATRGLTDRIWGSLTIFLVLGLTWLLGFLYVASGSSPWPSSSLWSTPCKVSGSSSSV
ncbi:adhesion G protein-coupled receptor L3-like isoform X2 [Penaeus japonicus]|uniref:adhesion G protein-coupled receptor L3-like isoform X2 n=1 Tax=Penaeus japonicus TaxID=27405 RepID=UPI001C715B11|nr:adhesion G protein-coupled receptor L3-like isoform X2 [Penaeus japonicus]